MGMQLGYTMMTEQAGPKDLVRYVVGAEETGFDFAVSSDHFFPWLEEMGHSPNAWVTLGAVAQATSRIPLMTYVTCPILRYHPVVVAQQATRELFDGDGYTNSRGDHFDVESAKLWALPQKRVPIGVAVSGEQSCRIAGELGDAMIGVEPRPELG